MAAPLLPSLLFRQLLILALAAGALSVRSPALGAAVLFLLFAVPEWKGARDGLRRAGALSLAALLGFLLMRIALPEVPDKPSWAAELRRAVLVTGEVDSVTELPGGRMRLVLAGLRPVAEGAPLLTEEMRKAMRARRYDGTEGGVKAYAGGVFEDGEAVLPGFVSLTVDTRVTERSGRPLAGQTMTALLRLFPSGGSGNADRHPINAYWAAREVWHSARLVWREGRPLYLEFRNGDGLSFQAAELRRKCRSAMTEALERQAPPSHEAELGPARPDTNSVSKGGNAKAARTFFAREPEAPAYSQGRAMLVALLFGDRSGLTMRTMELFTKAGLVHSLALSGQHLALAAMAGACAVALLTLLRPSVFYHVPRRVLLAWAGVPFAAVYLFFGGAPFSLVRAALMMLAGAFFLSQRRSAAPFDALFAAVLLLILGWPPALFELSAQLSVLAVAGILLALPLVTAFQKRFQAKDGEGRLRRAGKAALRWGASMLLVSLAAQAAVLPLLASVFGAVSPCLWLNVLWLPPLTFLTLPCAAIGLLLLTLFDAQFFSALLFEVAAWPADLMLSLLEMLDAGGWLPLIQFPRPAPLSALGYGAVFAALAFMVQRRSVGKRAGTSCRRLLLFGILFMLVGQMPQWLDEVKARWEERVTLSLLDVGQGQALLLEYPGGRILVDGGGSTSPYFDCGSSLVAPALTEGRMPHLDAVVLSHADVDHARGLRWILEHFSVDALYWSPVSAARADSGEARALRELARRHGIPEKTLKQGDGIELGGGLRLEVLSPKSGEEKRPEKELSNNNASLALRLVHAGHGLALFCGDMLSSALRTLAESGQPLKADVLVLPHHGAASSFQKKFYDKAAPRAALASAASFHHYGFPSRKVREEMGRRGIPLLSTTDLGTFGVCWKKRGGRYALELPTRAVTRPSPR